MTFNKMGTLPLPLALHLATYTVIGLFCAFAGGLNLIDPTKIIPNAVIFLGLAGFSWGYVFGILMARKEVLGLGVVAFIGTLGRKKGIEYAAPHLGRHAWSRVLDRQAHPVLPRLRGQLDDRIGTPAHGVLGIGHEIDDDLLELLAEAQHRLGGLIHAGAHLDVVGAEDTLADFRDVAHQLVELNPHRRDVGAAREAQQAADDARRAVP